MRLFKRKKNKETSNSVYDRWETNFSILKKNKFEIINKDKYNSRVHAGALELDLKRKNLFAWVDNGSYKYRNFFIEADISFRKDNGYSSAGFLLRRADDSNYYYFLVSNRGSYRFDLVFNGTPRQLIDWTSIDQKTDDRFSLRIIVHWNRFLFFINDFWVGEIEDESINSGGISFAGQNYDETENEVFFLNSFLIDSMPIPVETQYYRWAECVPVNPDSRIKLALTLYKNKQYTAAVIQIKKAFKDKTPSADDYLLLAECMINLKMYEQALESVNRSLKINEDREEAVIEKGNILYLLNRFLVLRDYLKEKLDKFAKNAVLWNLYGNAEYSLGNYGKAGEAYVQAAQIDPDMPLFLTNAARAFERADNSEKALSCYLEACRKYFFQEAYDDLKDVLPEITRLDSSNNEVKAIHGKVLFHEGDMDPAGNIFKELLDKNYRESSVCFMYGLILVVKGRRTDAVQFMQEAVKKESSYYLYWFKLAENLFLLGRDAKEAVDKALECKGDDPWVLSLAGQICMAGDNLQEAEEYFRRAAGFAPEQTDILIDLSECLFRKGEADAALSLLDHETGNPKLFNRKGNLLSRMGEDLKAFKAYEKALSLNPKDPVILENCAASCIELDMFSKAEELLAQLLDIEPSSSVFNLVGNLARLKGEYKRAEISYQEGIKTDPGNREISINYADLLVEHLEYKKAEKVLLEIKETEKTKREEKLLLKIRQAFEIKYTCANCKREWWVPRKIDMQPPLKLYGEPPAEAPAGKCPECGKVYCVECASKYLKDKRFVCPDCDKNLKLSDNYLKYLIMKYIDMETT